MINSLDGLTILRFTKSFKSGAGMEKYLEDIDSILLKRNKTTIIRMYLETGSKAGKPTNREIGQGTLVEFPMPVSVRVIQSKSDNHNIKQSSTSFFKGLFRELIIYNPFLYRVFFKDYIRKNYTKPGDFPVINAGEKVRKIHQEFKVDLLVMHHIGRIDSAEIIEEAKKLRIPYIYINHYSNDHFTNVSIREQIGDAAGIAGVSGLGVPRRLKGLFRNLSDGIDTEVFNPVQTRTPGIETDIPIIIYPARITRVKGQADLIKAYAKLKSEGLRAKIVFAGRTYSPEYEDELKGLARKNELTDDVLFIGQLNTEELRDWYGHSSV
ncbi:glycosyltransferase family 4 protein, partial [bacterium]|nr:glycosyltransferase family 4 protein [bacterium]